MPVHIHEQYLFYITPPDGHQWQAYPANATLDWKWSKDDEFGFFRKELDTELVFVNDQKRDIDDFDRLLALEQSPQRCNFTLIEVYMVCGPVIFPFWNGRLRMSAGNWDLTFCRATMKPEIEDPYTCLLDTWEEEKDFVSPIANEVNELTLGVSEGNYIEQKTCSWIVDNIADVEVDSNGLVVIGEVLENCPAFDDAGAAAWIVTESTIEQWTGDNYRVRAFIAREVGTGSCDDLQPTPPDGDIGWILLEDNCLTDSTWVRTPIVLGLDLFNVTLHNAYSLSDILQWYLSDSCGLAVVSNFYGINADGTAPDNIAYQKATAQLQDVQCIHFSDFQKDDEDGPDTPARRKISLKSWLDNLKAANNLRFAIDNGIFRLEHVSYFTRVRMLNLTHEDHVQWINGLYQYSYNKLKMPQREVFTWAKETDKDGADFDGVPIVYDDACVDPDNKEAKIEAPLFYTNLYDLYLARDPDAEEEYGIVLLATGGGAVLRDVGILSGQVKINGPLCWANIHEYYYKWDRPFFTGIMNKQPTQFYRWLKQKVQPDIPAFLCCDDLQTFDPDDLVLTQLGWGEVEEAALEAPRQKLTLQLLHE